MGDDEELRKWCLEQAQLTLIQVSDSGGPASNYVVETAAQYESYVKEGKKE